MKYLIRFLAAWTAILLYGMGISVTSSWQCVLAVVFFPYSWYNAVSYILTRWVL